VVREVGGLADTVVDASARAQESGAATGFVFREPTSGGLFEAVQRAAGLWHDTTSWRQLQRNAMAQDFSWQQSADRYLELYHSTTD
jgi:starch synthase